MKTKKLLVEIKLPSWKAGKQFLLPNFNKASDSFLNIKNSKNVSFGMVVYIGVEVSSEEILNRYLDNNSLEYENESYITIIDDYLNQINNFKIGNVLSVKYDNSNLILKKEYERISEKLK